MERRWRGAGERSLASVVAPSIGPVPAAARLRRVPAGWVPRVRAGRVRVPAHLPRDGDVDGDDSRLAQAYEGSWLAVELLIDEYGEGRVLRRYRRLGERRQGEPAVVLDEVLRSQLGTSARAFTAAWRAMLRGTLP